MNIITTFPAYLTLGCLALGLLYSWLVYFYKPQNEIPKRTRYILASLRFLFVFLLSFLLLSPLLLLNSKQIEKPLIVFAQDNSSSILYAKDSLYYKNEYLAKIDEIGKKLSDDFEYRLVTFDQSVHRNKNIDFNGGETNISTLFQELTTIYAGRNVGAIILASDGIFNKGGNPFYIAEKLPIPIYSIAMGDTLRQTDLVIGGVEYNKTTYYRNTFPVEILVNAFNLQSAKSKITITSNNQVLFSKDLTIKSKHHTETVRFFIEASKKGIQKYHISIDPIQGEFSTKNNQFDFFVNVLDSRDKILIAYETVHPDLGAIKQALLGSDMYQVDVKQVGQIDKPLNEYAAIFAYQLPNIKNGASKLFEDAKRGAIPLVYIVGTQTSIPALNQLNTGVQIQSQNNMTNDAFPILNQNFVLFSIPADYKQYIEELPPVVCPFGNYKLSSSTTAFLNQRIGNYNSAMPLFVFNNQLNSKNCVIIGEGIWKWRMASYQMYSHHRYFDDLITKIPQYLVSQSDNSNFRIKLKQLFNQNEPITALAELYNQSLELVNTSEVSFVIKDNQHKEFPFSFTRTDRSYRLEIGELLVGEYTWVARTELGDKKYQKNGAFVVQQANIESLNLTADFSLLNSLSKINGGKLISAKNIESVVGEIEKNGKIKPVSFFSKIYTELAQSWIFIVILLSLAVVEWFIRKYNGLF